MSSEICATLTPSSAGSMSFMTLRVVGSVHAARSALKLAPMRGRSPNARSAGICRASCSTLPTITPTHWA
ncbi:hypothetical protein D9M70_603680 [compost metagenome]